MIDQTRLPMHEEYVTCRTYLEVAAAIRDMIIRGAPAIGVAAAMGVALGVKYASEADLDAQVDTICETLARTRPTAVNLFWAIDRMKRLYTTLRGTAARRDSRAAGSGSATGTRGRYRHQPRHRAPRRAAGAGRQDRADALQCRRAGHRRIRHGARRDPRRHRERQDRSTCSPTRRARFCKARA